MIMCFLLCYPVSSHMLQLPLTGRPISSFNISQYNFLNFSFNTKSVPSSIVYSNSWGSIFQKYCSIFITTIYFGEKYLCIHYLEVLLRVS